MYRFIDLKNVNFVVPINTGDLGPPLTKAQRTLIAAFQFVSKLPIKTKEALLNWTVPSNQVILLSSDVILYRPCFNPVSREIITFLVETETKCFTVSNALFLVLR
jgi:hypothetical protein